MSRQTDTAAQSRAIALDLLKQGIRPTVKRVREQLGSTGSDTTVHNTLENEFWPEIGRRLSYPDWPDQLTEAIQTLWQLAIDKAQGGFDQYRKEMDERVSEVTAKCEELLHIRDQFSLELAQARVEREQLIAEAANISQQLNNEKTARRNAEADLQKAEAIVEQINKAFKQAEVAQQQALERETIRVDEIERRLVAQLEEQRTLRNNAEKREIQLTKQLQALNDKHSDLRAQLAETIATARQKDATFADLTEAHKTLNDKFQSQTQQLDKTIIGNKELLQKLMANEKIRLEDKSNLDEKVRQFRAIEIKFAKVEQENKVLRRQMKALINKVDSAGKEEG